MASCESSWLIIPQLSETNRNSFIAIATLQIILDFISFGLSLSALIAIFKLREHNFQYYVIMLSLCLTDLLDSLTNRPIYIVLIVLQARGSISCITVKLFELSAVFLCFIMFVLLLLAITERYIALYFPLKYQMWQSSKVIIGLNVMAWASAFVLTAIFRIKELKKGTSIFLLVLIAVGGFWMCVVHVRIFTLAFRVKRQIAAQASTVNIRNQRSTAMTKLTAALIVGSLACYIPFLLSMALGVFTSTHVSKILLHWLWFVLSTNSALNPIFFYILNKEIRRKILKLWRCNSNHGNDSYASSFAESGTYATHVMFTVKERVTK